MFLGKVRLEVPWKYQENQTGSSMEISREPDWKFHGNVKKTSLEVP
jgi:hypothetical protein